MPTWLYICLCLIVPPLWGIVAARLFDSFSRRRQKPVPVEDERMYYI
jgi:hypothetical protein